MNKSDLPRQVTLVALIVFFLITLKIVWSPATEDVSVTTGQSVESPSPSEPVKSKSTSKTGDEEEYINYIKKYFGQPCPKNIYEFENRSVRINRCGYSRDTRQIEAGDSTEDCADTMAEEVAKNEYNIVHSCLYEQEDAVFEKSLLIKAYEGDFGYEYGRTHWIKGDGDAQKSIGEGIREWFRFELNGKLYIYLYGAAGCGGCSYSGPYLIIDQSTGEIQLRDADLPRVNGFLLSPNKQKGIEYGWDQKEVYVYDLVAQKRLGQIFEIPEGQSFYYIVHDLYLIPGALEWLDEDKVQVHLVATDEYGVAKFAERKEGGSIVYDYEFVGDPIVIDLMEVNWK